MAKSIEQAIERSVLATRIIELARKARDTDRALDANQRPDNWMHKERDELAEWIEEENRLLHEADDAAQALWTALDEWDKQGEAHDTYHCG
jgi:hypothetical protein